MRLPFVNSIPQTHDPYHSTSILSKFLVMSSDKLFLRISGSIFVIVTLYLMYYITHPLSINNDDFFIDQTHYAIHVDHDLRPEIVRLSTRLKELEATSPINHFPGRKDRDFNHVQFSRVLLIFQSEPGDISKRNAIRNTIQVHSLHQNVEYLFWIPSRFSVNTYKDHILDSTSHTSPLDHGESLLKEFKKHNDIIVLDIDLTETPSESTGSAPFQPGVKSNIPPIKKVSKDVAIRLSSVLGRQKLMFETIYDNFFFEVLVVSNDNFYVNLDPVIGQMNYFLKKFDSVISHTLIGDIRERHVYHQGGRRIATGWESICPDWFPPYPKHNVFALSHDLVEALSQRHLDFITVADSPEISTGAWLSSFQINYINSPVAIKMPL